MDEEMKELLRDLNSLLQTLGTFLACYISYKALKIAQDAEKELRASKKPDEDTAQNAEL